MELTRYEACISIDRHCLQVIAHVDITNMDHLMIMDLDTDPRSSGSVWIF